MVAAVYWRRLKKHADACGARGAQGINPAVAYVERATTDPSWRAGSLYALLICADEGRSRGDIIDFLGFLDKNSFMRWLPSEPRFARFGGQLTLPAKPFRCLTGLFPKLGPVMHLAYFNSR
jgi:hypothetical protein